MKKLFLPFFLVSVLIAGNYTEAAETNSSTLPPEAQEVLVETQSIEPQLLPEEMIAIKEQTPKAEEVIAVTKPPMESEIPLNLEKKSQASTESGSLARILGGAFVLLTLGGGAYFCLRRYSKPGQRVNAPQIKILTQHWLGPKKSLAIVRVAGESILIGVTDQNISMIKALALIDDEVPEETPDKFDRVLQSEEAFAKALPNVDDEEFMISGLSQVKESVSQRLKGMRSIQ